MEGPPDAPGGPLDLFRAQISPVGEEFSPASFNKLLNNGHVFVVTAIAVFGFVF